MNWITALGFFPGPHTLVQKIFRCWFIQFISQPSVLFVGLTCPLMHMVMCSRRLHFCFCPLCLLVTHRYRTVTHNNLIWVFVFVCLCELTTTVIVFNECILYIYCYCKYTVVSKYECFCLKCTVRTSVRNILWLYFPSRIGIHQPSMVEFFYLSIYLIYYCDIKTI